MNFSGNKDGSSTQTGRPSPLAHPIPLHPLNKFDGSQDDLLGSTAQVKGSAIPVNVKGRIDDGQLTLEIKKLEQLQEAPGQLKQIHVHLVAEIDQEIGLLNNVTCTLLDRRAI